MHVFPKRMPIFQSNLWYFSRAVYVMMSTISFPYCMYNMCPMTVYCSISKRHLQEKKNEIIISDMNLNLFELCLNQKNCDHKNKFHGQWKFFCLLFNVSRSVQDVYRWLKVKQVEWASIKHAHTGAFIKSVIYEFYFDEHIFLFLSFSFPFRWFGFDFILISFLPCH